MFKSKSSMSRALVRRETTAGYLFLLPSLFFFVTFVLYPMFLCIYTSFFDSNMGKNAVDVFVGLGNYKELFRDKLFLGALKNTVVIVVVAVPTVCAFSLWVATAIYDMKPALTSAFRCIFYLPVVTGSVAVTVVWKWMYNSRYGVFNYLFKSLGIIDQNINWLGDARFALWCIILFWKIKWSQIMPTTLYILIITTINSFQCFALIQLLTSGGPTHSTDTIMYYIYYTAFKLYRYGYGNAMGVVLMIIIAVLSAVQFKLGQQSD